MINKQHSWHTAHARLIRTTLLDQISGRVIHESKPGPSLYHNKEEESELVQFVAEIYEIGYGKTRNEANRGYGGESCQ